MPSEEVAITPERPPVHPRSQTRFITGRIILTRQSRFALLTPGGETRLFQLSDTAETDPRQLVDIAIDRTPITVEYLPRGGTGAHVAERIYLGTP